MEKTSAAYGTWRSPISADLLASAGISLGYVQVTGVTVYWVEGRPLEQGRYVIVKRTSDGQIADVTPAGYNARTLVHEYGGGMYLVHEDVVYFSNFADQRLYRQAGNHPPQPITPEPPTPRSLRYADGRLTPDGRWLICVRERHESSGVVNELVALPTDGATPPTIIAEGYDFYAAPRVSPDGSKLAWIAWRHPQLPWDGTELWVADLDANAHLRNARHVAGSTTESIMQPQWQSDGTLYFISDRSNWWNLYCERAGQIEAVAPISAEIGGAQWVFGLCHYVFLADGTIACIYTEHGFDHLGLIAPGSQTVQPVSCAYTTLSSLATDGTTLWMIGGGPTSHQTLLALQPQTGALTPLRASFTGNALDERFIAHPEPFAFPTENNLTAHAIFYPPTNPLFTAPATEKPPLIVISHGGPTGATSTQLNLKIQYWTSRGFGVVDVNYGGSTGYGRDYRQRLQGSWGIVDVMDCINAARYLIAQGRADEKRVAIRGGSAGGYTTLRALTWQNFFATGASYYGLAALETFVHDTHKFESRYLDYLIGPYPEEQARYAERSPVNWADQLNVPVILLQGLEDKIVPPSQAEIMVASLAKKGLPYAYLAFEGEQHGFRKAENIIRTAEAELYFYGRIFGFMPADEIEPVQIVNL